MARISGRIGEIVIDDDDLADIPVLEIELLKDVQLRIYDLFDEGFILYRPGTDSHQLFMDPEDTGAQILRRAQLIFLKEGDLDTSSSDVDDGCGLFQNTVENIARRRQ